MEDEEITFGAITLGEASDDVRIKLQDILQLLNQYISSLVQDAEGIRRILRLLKGQLPADVESFLLPVAFIEGHQYEVLEAQQCLADKASQAQLIHQKEVSQFKENDIKARVELLENSRPTIASEIDRLKAQRAKPMKKLEVVKYTLTEEEKR